MRQVINLPVHRCRPGEPSRSCGGSRLRSAPPRARAASRRLCRASASRVRAPGKPQGRPMAARRRRSDLVPAAAVSRARHLACRRAVLDVGCAMGPRRGRHPNLGSAATFGVDRRWRLCRGTSHTPTAASPGRRAMRCASVQTGTFAAVSPMVSRLQRGAEHAPTRLSRHAPGGLSAWSTQAARSRRRLFRTARTVSGCRGPRLPCWFRSFRCCRSAGPLGVISSTRHGAAPSRRGHLRRAARFLLRGKSVMFRRRGLSIE